MDFFDGEGAAGLAVDPFHCRNNGNNSLGEIHVQFELLSGFWSVVYYYVAQVPFSHSRIH
uniref:Uncharacterized protein n=1 Tax=Picea sitchensis TaxID=3332 RepID=A9NL70_PICSI|nr:unknown [Picea sitchensis]ABK24969.1 unknown [Picea sitchensis]ABR16266.1 unknown [Picea sitchensis]